MQHSDFGYWAPHDAHRFHKPEPGSIVAYDFKPWRLIDIRRDVEHRDHPGRKYIVYRLRPLDAGDSSDRDEHRGWTYGGPVVLDEHYGLCVHCNELLPCRATMARRAAEKAAERMKRYETPGVCPACQEPVTLRQEHETFPNVVVPIGPPVTFHAGRRKCRSAMERYRKQAVQPETQLRIDGGEDCE